MTKIERQSFNFPQNITKEVDIKDIVTIKTLNLKNKCLHLKVTIDTLQKKSYNAEILAEEIKQFTGAERVKITFILNTETNERSKEVTDQKSSLEKFKAYAELNEIQYSKSTLDKIEDIENNTDLKLITPSDSFTLEYVSIRGAIGLMDKNPERKEFEIDFTKFDDGLTILTGPFGAGKTTIIENCHPYPQMLTRVGSLKDHFCLKDSHRKLIYSDSKGKKYRISMIIDGVAKSVGTLYSVETKMPDSEVWMPLKSVDGSHDSYLNWCNNTFGSLAIYLRTAFFAKETVKSVPNLKVATKGDKMELFSILAGTDYLTTIKEQAKAQEDILKKELEKVRSQLDGYSEINEKLTDFNELIKTNKSLILENKDTLKSDEAELIKYEDLQKDYIAAVNSYDMYRTSLKECTTEETIISNKILQTKNNISGYRSHIADFESYKKAKSDYEDSVNQKKELTISSKEIQTKISETQRELDLKDVDYSSLSKKLLQLQSRQVQIDAELKALIKTKPVIKDTCPVCGGPLSDHKLEELKKELSDIETTITKLQSEQTDTMSEIEKVNGEIEKLDIDTTRGTLRTLNQQYSDISFKIQTLDDFMSSIDIVEITNILTNTESALSKEEDYLNELQNKQVSLKEKISDYESKLANLPTDYSDKVARLKRGIDYVKSELVRLETESDMAQKELDKLKDYEAQVNLIKEQETKIISDMNDYEIIQKAFGNNGIQALELDSAAPEIADIANSILSETYSDRFTVSFDTQRVTKDKKKVIDDFIINVFDSDSGRLKRLDLISSGEGALINQVLYYAFSVIRARRTGFCFRTRFLDEADGSLDSDARVVYLKMIESAHRHCNAKQTILITHSAEIKDLVEQKIEL